MDETKAVTFKLEIACDNAAFEDEPHLQIADILRDVANRIANGGDPIEGTVRDVNGNTVGRFRMVEEDV